MEAAFFILYFFPARIFYHHGMHACIAFRLEVNLLFLYFAFMNESMMDWNYFLAFSRMNEWNMLLDLEREWQETRVMRRGEF